MTLPTYTRWRRYFDAQQASPGTVLNGADFDTDYDRIAAFADSVVAAIAQVRRDDGALVNGIVTMDSLSAALSVVLGGWNPRGAWATATLYAVKDFVTSGGNNYVANTAHTSGVSIDTTKFTLVAAQGATGGPGPTGPAPWGAAAAWVTAMVYSATAPASLVTFANETYACLVAHTSGVFATDLAASKWIKVAAQGATGEPGTAGANWTAGEVYASPTITSNVLTLDMSTGTTVFKVTVNANINTLTITGAPAAKASGFLLELIANGSAFTYAGLKIAGGVLKAAGGAEFPTLTTTTGKKDVISVWTDDGGTTWNYAVVGQAF